MSSSGYSGYSGTSTAGFLSTEATSLLEQAKKYRALMEALPEGDPNRSVYEGIIRDLLERSRRYSSFVINTTSGST